jgi:murein DD-endopeptidase MepM/ murein hydrolase activator NlpD
MFGYVTIYCHMSKFLVKVGQKVKRGDTIGLVGSTGKARGPHVHYEVQLNSKEKNPYYFLLEE